MIDQKLQPPELKGLGKRIMEQLDITAEKVEERMENERIGEIHTHIDHLMHGTNQKEFMEKVSQLQDVGFRLGIETGAICGIKLDLENKYRNRLLWTNQGFCEAANGVIDKANVKRTEVQKVAIDYGVDNTKKAMSNVLIKIWSILTKSA